MELAEGAAWVYRTIAATVPGGPTLQTLGPVRFLHTHQAVGGSETDINAMLRHRAAAARREIIIEAAYLIVNDQWEGVLRQAACRGVRVTLLSNSLASTDMPVAYAGQANQQRKLLAAGVRLYEYRGPRTLHAKALLLDDAAFVGSYNVHPRSDYEDSETGVLIDDPAVAATLRASLGWHLSDSSPVRQADCLLNPASDAAASPVRNASLPLLRLAAPLIFKEL